MNTIIIALLLIILIMLTAICVLGTVASRANDAKARAQRALSEHIRYHAIERGELKADVAMLQGALTTANSTTNELQLKNHALRKQHDAEINEYIEDLGVREDKISELLLELIDLRLECSEAYLKNADLQTELNELRWTEVQAEQDVDVKAPHVEIDLYDDVPSRLI